jgi:hypothetical protein
MARLLSPLLSALRICPNRSAVSPQAVPAPPGSGPDPAPPAYTEAGAAAAGPRGGSSPRTAARVSGRATAAATSDPSVSVGPVDARTALHALDVGLSHLVEAISSSLGAISDPVTADVYTTVLEQSTSSAGSSGHISHDHIQSPRTNSAGSPHPGQRPPRQARHRAARQRLPAPCAGRAAELVIAAFAARPRRPSWTTGPRSLIGRDPRVRDDGRGSSAGLARSSPARRGSTRLSCWCSSRRLGEPNRRCWPG